MIRLLITSLRSFLFWSILRNYFHLYLVHVECDVRMDSKHFSQLILVVDGFQVAIEHVFHHVQERGVVVLDLHLS